MKVLALHNYVNKCAIWGVLLCTPYIFSSCSSNEGSSSETPFAHEIMLDCSNPKPLAELDLVRSLNLEMHFLPISPGEGLPEHLWKGEKYTVIWDEKLTGSIWVFDTSHQLVEKIARRGRGPGEYQEVYDVAVNELTGQLVVSSNRSFVTIDLSTFESVGQPSPFYQDNFFAFDHHYYIYNPENRPSADSRAALIKLDANIQPVNYFLPTPEFYANSTGTLNNSVSFDGMSKMFLFRYLSDTIYSLEQGDVFSKYILTFGKASAASIPFHRYSNIDEVRNYVLQNEIIHFDFPLVFHDHLFFVKIVGNTPVISCYDLVANEYYESNTEWNESAFLIFTILSHNAVASREGLHFILDSDMLMELAAAGILREDRVINGVSLSDDKLQDGFYLVTVKK